MIKILVTVDPSLIGDVSGMAAIRTKIRSHATDAGFDESMFAKYGIMIVKIAVEDPVLAATLRQIPGVYSVSGDGAGQPVT